MNSTFELEIDKMIILKVSCFLVDSDVNLVTKTVAMIKRAMSVTLTILVLRLIKTKN